MIPSPLEADRVATAGITSLPANEIRVWTAALDAIAPEQLEAESAALLDPEERARASRKRLTADRRVFELAHVLLRRALSTIAPIAPAAWRIGHEPGGRPRVAGPETSLDLRISLSHTRGLAACAIASGRDVGVDVEDLSAEVDVTGLGAVCLTDAERAGLDESAGAERLLTAFTLKEAYLKARGTGLAIDLRSFAVRLDPPALATPPPDDEAAHWLFAARRPTPAHALAIAARRTGEEPLVVRYFDGLPP